MPITCGPVLADPFVFFPCIGALIGRRTILTAAHCHDPNVVGGVSIEQIKAGFVLIGGNELDKGRRYKVSSTPFCLCARQSYEMRPARMWPTCGSVALCGSVWLWCGAVWRCVALCGAVWLCVAPCASDASAATLCVARRDRTMTVDEAEWRKRCENPQCAPSAAPRAALSLAAAAPPAERVRTYARTHVRTYAHTHIRTYARTHVRGVADRGLYPEHCDEPWIGCERLCAGSLSTS